MLIVTHKNPDPDAICAVWLLKRFYPGLAEAEVKFVNAGETYQNRPVDSDPELVHVDTGFGKFDHHDTQKRTCAAKLVLDFLQKEGKTNFANNEWETLERLVEVITQDDHFEDCYWPEANDDRYSFWLTPILDGLKRGGQLDDGGLVEFGGKCLDGVFGSLKLKLEAEQELQKKGIEFASAWGLAVGIESKNDEVMKVAQKQGKVLVVRKDPGGMVRIKAPAKSGVDLSSTYEVLRKMDPHATWFLHASKRMLLNGSYKNPAMVPSRLSLGEIIEVLKGK